MMEVLDKGKAAAVTVIVETKDKHTGKVIFENQSTLFIRGSGGFGGKRAGKGAYPMLCEACACLVEVHSSHTHRPRGSVRREPYS